MLTSSSSFAPPIKVLRAYYLAMYVHSPSKPRERAGLQDKRIDERESQKRLN